MDEWKSGPDDLPPECDITYIADVKGAGGARLYFMSPGKQTNTFLWESLPCTGAKTYPAYRRAQQTNYF